MLEKVQVRRALLADFGELGDSFSRKCESLSAFLRFQITKFDRKKKVFGYVYFPLRAVAAKHGLRGFQFSDPFRSLKRVFPWSFDLEKLTAAAKAYSESEWAQTAEQIHLIQKGLLDPFSPASFASFAFGRRTNGELPAEEEKDAWKRMLSSDFPHLQVGALAAPPPSQNGSFSGGLETDGLQRITGKETGSRGMSKNVEAVVVGNNSGSFT